MTFRQSRCRHAHFPLVTSDTCLSTISPSAWRKIHIVKTTIYSKPSTAPYNWFCLERFPTSGIKKSCTTSTCFTHITRQPWASYPIVHLEYCATFSTQLIQQSIAEKLTYPMWLVKHCGTSRRLQTLAIISKSSMDVRYYET